MASILDRVQKIQDIPQEPFHICLYGEPKSGKTVFACSFPGAFLIDCDKTGFKSLRNHENTQDVPVFRPRSFKDVFDIVMEIRKGRLPEIKTVVLDTISEMNKLALTESLHSKLAQPNTKRQRWDYWMADFKENTEIMREIIVELRDLDNVNTIIVAHEATRIDKDTEAKEIGPALPPKALESLEATQDLIGYFTVRVSNNGEEKRKLRVKRNSIIMAGTRYKVDKPEIEDPTVEKLLQILNTAKVETNAS